MTFLLTNDDGYDAPGLAALADAARPFGRAVTAAPHVCHSSGSHRVTTHQPFRVTGSGKLFIIEGTPADCVRVGLDHLASDADWVLAGVNAGGNLGADVFLSGTVAAAREAALLGKPAVAFSHYRRRNVEYDWPRVIPWVTRVLRELLGRPQEAGVFWNVNLPHLDANASEPAFLDCPLDTSRMPVRFERDGELVRYSGDYHQRPRISGGDIDVCFRGGIAVTRLSLG